MLSIETRHPPASGFADSQDPPQKLPLSGNGSKSQACQVHTLQPFHRQSVSLRFLGIHQSHLRIRLLLSHEVYGQFSFCRNSCSFQNGGNGLNARCRHDQIDALRYGRHRNFLLIAVVQRISPFSSPCFRCLHTGRRIHLVCLAVSKGINLVMSAPRIETIASVLKTATVPAEGKLTIYFVGQKEPDSEVRLMNAEKAETYGLS